MQAPEHVQCVSYGLTLESVIHVQYGCVSECPFLAFWQTACVGKCTLQCFDVLN